MYRQSNSAQREQVPEELSPLEKLVNTVFQLGYFVLAPAFAVILVNWAMYSISASTWYQEHWMAPILLVLGTFMGGVLIRMRLEEEDGEMGMFMLAIIALIVFAWLTRMDLFSGGDVYGRFLPKLLKYSLEPYIYAIPGIGIAGMLFYKQFTIKHYN